MTGARKVRTCTPSDIPAIRSIALETWPVAYKEILSPDQLAYMLELMYSDQALRTQFAHGHRFILLQSGVKPVGFAGFEHNYSQQPVTRLHKLYVLPRTQGTGAGKALLEAVCIATREATNSILELNVNKYNRSKAFYLRHGFAITRDEIIDIGSGYFMDDHVMELTL